MALEMTWYMRNMLLRDSDWASMAHSLEIRVPLVDVVFLQRVVPLLARCPGLGKKQFAMASWGNPPQELLARPKTGVPYIIRPLGSLDPFLYRQSRFGNVALPLKRLYERLFDIPNLNHAAAIHYAAQSERRHT